MEEDGPSITYIVRSKKTRQRRGDRKILTFESEPNSPTSPFQREIPTSRPIKNFPTEDAVFYDPELNEDIDGAVSSKCSDENGSRRPQQQRGDEEQPASLSRINHESQPLQRHEMLDERRPSLEESDVFPAPSEDDWELKMSRIKIQNQEALRKKELADRDEACFRKQEAEAKKRELEERERVLEQQKAAETTAELMRIEREKNAERKRRDMLAKGIVVDGLKFAHSELALLEDSQVGMKDDRQIEGDDGLRRDHRSSGAPSPSPSCRNSTLQANISENVGPVPPVEDQKVTNGMDSKKKRVLVAATGSVASIKLPILVRLLQAKGDIEVRVVATERASHFFKEKEIEAPLYSDKHEWEAWQKMADPVLHINLRTWADLIVIAPLDANTLAKLACGMCDNLITCILRAWDMAKPVIVCPAMNTAMWTHPHTAAHLNVVADFLGYNVIQPVSKTLACGDTGVGAMAEPGWIVTVVRGKLLSTTDE